MSDLLAKCDWDGDELRVELPQWPEVMTVWVNGKAMPYVPVVNDSKCYTCEAMLDCDECLRADASHKELRGLQAENRRLRELCRHLYACNQYCDREESGGCSACPYQPLEYECGFEERLLELGIEVE